MGCHPGPCSKRVTQSEMGITNGIDVFTARSGGVTVMPANNDNVVRIFDAEASCCHTCALSRLAAHPTVSHAQHQSLGALSSVLTT